MVENMTREEKVKFLLSAEKQLPQYFNYSNKNGDFSTISEEHLDQLVEELDWMWK